MVEVTFISNERKIGIQELSEFDLSLETNVEDMVEWESRANTKMLKKEKGSQQAAETPAGFG